MYSLRIGRKFVWGAALALVAVATSTQKARAEVKQVTIGYLPNIVLPQPLVGLQRGEYAKRVRGVRFIGKDYPAGPAVLEALRAGVVDIAYTGPYPPMKAFVKDKDVILLAGAAKGGTELLVPKNSPIRSIRDLRGKAIGINQLGSTVDAMVRYRLVQAGLAPDRDVRLLVVEPAQQADALKRGEVAAVAAPAPWPSVVKASGNGRALLGWRPILDNGNYLAGVVFTTRKFAQANPNFVRQFVAAHRAITNRLNSNRARGNAEVLAAWSRVTKKKMQPAVANAGVLHHSVHQCRDAARLRACSGHRLCHGHYSQEGFAARLHLRTTLSLCSILRSSGTSASEPKPA
jgi:NitT/TauT family transport system substrate-binding protein